MASGRSSISSDPWTLKDPIKSRHQGYPLHPKRGDSIARWADVETEAPELTKLARTYLDAHVHKTIATLRRDGSPRISGTECIFFDGDLWFGSMWGAQKALDLQRDPRFALHSASQDTPSWEGDSKIAGKAEEITDRETIAAVVPDAGSASLHLFRADITELVVVALAPHRKSLMIDVWRPGKGLSRYER